MKRALLILLVGVLIGAWANAWDTRYDRRGGERIVAGLPGVGQGWIDTLRLVARDVVVDTINPKMLAGEGPYLLGLEEPYHDFVSVRYQMIAYARFLRLPQTGSFDYVHPNTLSNPPAVVAHEFGHYFQSTLWPSGHGGVWREGDTLPTFAQDLPERFADRFSRAMMALRGWDDPDLSDIMLNHVVHYRLMRALSAP